MYKRLFYATLAAFVLTLTFSVFAVMDAYADRPITVYVDGKKVEFPDAQPQMIDGRIFVPIRFVSEALEATVERDAATNSVFITSLTTETEATEPKQNEHEPEMIQAEVGEVIELPNAKIKVKELVYSEQIGTRQAKEGTRFATVYLDIYTDEKPETALTWTLSNFFDAFLLSDGREIRNYALGVPNVTVGEWNSKNATLLDLDNEYDVVGVIVTDPIDDSKKARIDF